jgi:general secretion pathway protein D
MTANPTSILADKRHQKTGFSTGLIVQLAASIALSGCAASPDQRLIPAALIAKPEPLSDAVARPAPGAAKDGAKAAVTATPQLPQPSRLSTVKPSRVDDDQSPATLTMMFDQLPLPSFINVVFGSMLKKSFNIDPAVAVRTDLVTLRTGKPQTPQQVLEAATTLLKSFGVSVTEMGGFYRIAPDNSASAYAPEIRRGRAQPDVPLPLRPVFNLVEMSAVRASDVSGWLKAMFGARLSIQDDATRNALMISGQPADITAALEAIQVLDQPLMRGRHSRFITPASLSAEDLSRKLTEILGAEGYVAGGAGSGLPISLIPIGASNSLLIFAVDPVVLGHVVDWAQKLDALGNDPKKGGRFFAYRVKYSDAQNMAKTMQEVMSGTGTTTPTMTQLAPGMRVIGDLPVVKPPGRIVVNAATNTLIFTSTADEYEQILAIMRELDQPSKSALIEVTVAEVRVSDQKQLGIDWNLPATTVDGRAVTGGTLGAVNVGTGGFSLSFLNNAGAVRANLNALASANRANILSTPRVMARNGESATIQVGQEVPIVTSQQSSGITNTTGGAVSPGVLQTIQYRNTGVILKVKPVIFAGNRIELEVSQEVSSAGATTTGVTTSPTFSSRKIDTKLSIRDGATVLLGGLISTADTAGNAGVPLLKDLPGVGQLFRSNNDSRDKTELIVLITPYVIDDDLVAEQVTQAFRSQLGAWALPASAPIAPAARPAPAPPAVPSPAPPAAAENLPAAADQGTAPLIPEAPRPRSESPEPPPAAPKSDLPAAASAAALPAANPAPAGPQINIPAGGVPVTDEKILEELRKANAPAASANPAAKPLNKKKP